MLRRLGLISYFLNRFRFGRGLIFEVIVSFFNLQCGSIWNAAPLHDIAQVLVAMYTQNVL